MKEIKLEKIFKIININIENTVLQFDQANVDLSEFGMDSITFVRIIVCLEEEFECEIPDAKLIMSEMNTVNKIFEVLNIIKDESIEN